MFHTERGIMKATIGKEYSFVAGHQLWKDEWSEEKNREVFGGCANEHGHNYEVTVSITGPVRPETGMVLNYRDLNKIVKPIIDPLDHIAGGLHKGVEYFAMGTMTTAENIARYLHDKIRSKLIQMDPRFQSYLLSVSVSETPKTYAEYNTGDIIYEDI